MVHPERLKQTQVMLEEVRKLALERRITPEIRSVFSQMVTEYVAVVTETGSAPKALDFQSEWNAIFLRHYRRVARVFLPNQRRSSFYDAFLELERKQTLSPQVNQELIASFSRWSREFGERQAALVTETNQNDYVTALQRATEQVPEDSSQVVIAAAAGVALRDLFRSRVDRIANVQTQAPAEEAKRREAIAIAVSDGKQEDELIKVWRTVGDANVRIAHVAANGQQRPGNAAFSVDGEDLRFPGDSSLGASAENVINCRCAAIWL